MYAYTYESLISRVVCLSFQEAVGLIVYGRLISGSTKHSSMVNEMVVAEHQVAKEVIQLNDPKPCIPLTSVDEKSYVPTMLAEKNAELVHGQEHLVMIAAEQTNIPLADMGMFEGSMINVVQQTHIATPHMQHVAATSVPYYQLIPPPATCYQQAHHYAATVAATPTFQHTSDSTHPTAVTQPYPPATFVYMPMQAYYQETQPTPMRHHAAIANVSAMPAGMAYQHVPMEYTATAVTSANVQSQPQQQQPSASQQTTISSNTNYSRSSNRRVVWNFCQFCQNNKESEEFYKSHTLRDTTGRVICPVLRAYNCPLCNNGGGDRAHTKSYCPQLRNRQPLTNSASHNGRRGHSNHNSHHGHGGGNRQIRAHNQQFQPSSVVMEQEPNKSFSS